MQFQVHKKVRRQKRKKRDFRSNINFLIPHVCLSLNIPRNQPDPDEGRGGDARERSEKYFICFQFPKLKFYCINAHQYQKKGPKAKVKLLDFNHDIPMVPKVLIFGS